MNMTKKHNTAKYVLSWNGVEIDSKLRLRFEKFKKRQDVRYLVQKGPATVSCPELC
jgi:hypothetical protein